MLRSWRRTAKRSREENNRKRDFAHNSYYLQRTNRNDASVKRSKKSFISLRSEMLICLMVAVLVVSDIVNVPCFNFHVEAWIPSHSSYTSLVSMKNTDFGRQSMTLGSSAKIKETSSLQQEEEKDDRMKGANTLSQAMDYETYESQKLGLQLVLIDNYDSYTYNIYSYLSTICKHPPIVISNDAYESWEELVEGLKLSGVEVIDGLIISPGPGRPERKEDMGVCLEAIEKNPSLPILGVCLGHQALGYVYGAKVDLAPNGPVHGLISNIFYDDNTKQCLKNENEICNLFADIQENFGVVRYHSLVVDIPKGNNLDIEATAWCKSDTEAESGDGNDEICMALRHKSNPHYGVQFHPESVGTGEHGYKIFENFSEFCMAQKTMMLLNGVSNSQKSEPLINGDTKSKDSSTNVSVKSKYSVFVHKMYFDDSVPLPEQVFEELYAEKSDSFWLDSSTGRKDADIKEMNKISDFNTKTGCPIVSNSRFSIMGCNDGPLSHKLEYWGKDHKPENRQILRTDMRTNEREQILDKDIISCLHDEIVNHGFTENVRGIDFENSSKAAKVKEIEYEIPFDFRGGYIGYLGYEVWHDTRETLCDQEMCGTSIQEKVSLGCSNPLVPTAAFIFADQSLVFDHWRNEWYLVAVSAAENENGLDSVTQWMQKISESITKLVNMPTRANKTIEKQMPLNFDLKRDIVEYSDDIARCHEEIRNGESYELCLTNQLTTSVSMSAASSDQLSNSPFGLYKILRKNNPAPFSSFLNFNSRKGEDNGSAVSICCSSPERFLSVKREAKTLTVEDESDRNHGWEFAPPFVSKNRDLPKFIVESKPIKGTTSRIFPENESEKAEAKKADEMVAQELQTSVKNRAENLMIVDLLRNDLSRVCEAGSVHVPKLMGIESFATVHQMVSTIRGIVDQKYTPIDVIAACFPGGSMTGAPKLRSVDILDELELGQSRGPYSGCLGYISLDGSMDMNIVIRTAVVTPNQQGEDGKKSWNVSIGAGGAITALSESNDEFQEMLLKAKAIKKSVVEWNSLCNSGT